MICANAALSITNFWLQQLRRSAVTFKAIDKLILLAGERSACMDLASPLEDVLQAVVFRPAKSPRTDMPDLPLQCAPAVACASRSSLPIYLEST